MPTKIPCAQCQGSGLNGACPTCGGDGEVDALEQFGITEPHLMAMFKMAEDTRDKVNDIKQKVDEIKDIVDNL